MSKAEIFFSKSGDISSDNFNPRHYSPIFLAVQKSLKDHIKLESFVTSKITSGTTPSAWFFRKKYEDGVPFVKTSAIRRDFININDLHFITSNIHGTRNKRTITRPFNVIFSMTGKFMGKATLSPPQIKELNMSQNSVLLKCNSFEESAFLTIFLNSKINQLQIKGIYSITKQKFINQARLSKLKILKYNPLFKNDCNKYYKNIKLYYDSVIEIQKIIEEFNADMCEPDIFDKKFIYILNRQAIDNQFFLPQFHRNDFSKIINYHFEKTSIKLRDFDIIKGVEPGSSNYVEKGIPFIKTSDFQNFEVDLQPDNYCTSELYKNLKQDLKEGDILFTKDGKIGEVSIVNSFSKFLISSGIVRLRISNEIDKYWVFLLLSSNYGKILFQKYTVIASTMAHLHSDFFNQFFLPVKKDKDLAFIQKLKTAFEKKSTAFSNIQLYKYNVQKMLSDIK